MPDELSDELMRMILDDIAEEEIDNKSRDNYVRSAFAWPGNKFNSLEHIIPRFPCGSSFIEGCGGSGVVTINLKNQYPLRVFNDRHAGVTSFFRCMRDAKKKEAVKDWLRLTLHSREEFIICRDTWENENDDVERAAKWYYMVRTSFGALGRNWARSTLGRAQSGAALHNGLELLDTVHRHFREVQIENMDICQLIRDYDFSWIGVLFRPRLHGN